MHLENLLAQGQFREVSFYVGIQIDMLPIIAGTAQGKTTTTTTTTKPLSPKQVGIG